jgi:hypothetical protein
LLDSDLDDREERWAVDRMVVEGEEVVKKRAMAWTSEWCISRELPRS